MKIGSSQSLGRCEALVANVDSTGGGNTSVNKAAWSGHASQASGALIGADTSPVPDAVHILDMNLNQSTELCLAWAGVEPCGSIRGHNGPRFCMLQPSRRSHIQITPSLNICSHLAEILSDS